jgi:amino acid adenylation domain-containing protein
LHHAISDGWSLRVLARELGTIYAAFVESRPSPLPQLPIQYADYAVWQRARLEGGGVEPLLAYWTRRLEGAPEALDLEIDRPRSSSAGGGGARVPVAIDAARTESLRALGRRAGATLFMTLLAAFGALLQRYSGQDDIVIGTPFANRTCGDVENLVGLFTNALPLRVDLSGDPTFLELLTAVREATLDAYAHQETPFELLVQALGPRRDPLRNPLFQVMLVLQDHSAEVLSFSGVSLAPVSLDTSAAKFDLTLSLGDTTDGLRGAFEYDASIFDEATVARMADHLGTLLDEAVAAPTRRVSTLPLSGMAALEARIEAWNRAAIAISPDACLHELVEAQCERTPQAPAVIDAGRTSTYAEIVHRARQLARHLRRAGVGPSSLVGIHLERSAEMIIAVLGVLMAGAAYLPLDTAHPPRHLELVIDDARVDLVLSRRESMAALAALAALGARVIALDADEGTIAREDDAPIQSGATPLSAAYVIYTSGSTGFPKGVVGHHRGIVNRVRWLGRAYPFGPDEVCCQRTAPSFVDSIAEMFMPLAHGVPLLVLANEAAYDPALLLRALQEARVTRIVAVPSLIEALLDFAPDLGARVPLLRLWISSGEALSPLLCALFAERVPGATLLNLYGSSEVAADATWHEIGPADAARRPPIGTPIANTRVYVLDHAMRMVAEGVPGDLYVAGVGIAHGYLRRPALTAERFLPDPFSGVPGARLYRTGDRARLRADGALDYLGRSDRQVKIRGQRVEPAEIEAAIRCHPAVRDAAVTAGTLGSGGVGLFAYVVPAATRPSPDELHAFLRGSLPDYMVPSGLVLLDALPRTPGGKLDRRALPAPVAQRAPTSPVAPRSPTERALAAIWGEVLAIDEVGAHDGFFERGGHSLLAMRIVGRVAARLGVELPLRAVFEAPTLAGMASTIDRLRGERGRTIDPLRAIERPSIERLLDEVEGDE